MISIPKMEIIGRIMKPVRRSDMLLRSDMWMMMTDTRMDIVMTLMVMVSFPRMEIIGWVMKPVVVQHVGGGHGDGDDQNDLHE